MLRASVETCMSNKPVAAPASHTPPLSPGAAVLGIVRLPSEKRSLSRPDS